VLKFEIVAGQISLAVGCDSACGAGVVALLAGFLYKPSGHLSLMDKTEAPCS